jgi:hypothetical protein
LPPPHISHLSLFNLWADALLLSLFHPHVRRRRTAPLLRRASAASSSSVSQRPQCFAEPLSRGPANRSRAMGWSPSLLRRRRTFDSSSPSSTSSMSPAPPPRPPRAPAPLRRPRRPPPGTPPNVIRCLGDEVEAAGNTGLCRCRPKLHRWGTSASAGGVQSAGTRWWPPQESGGRAAPPHSKTEGLLSLHGPPCSSMYEIHHV